MDAVIIHNNIILEMNPLLTDSSYFSPSHMLYMAISTDTVQIGVPL